MQETISKVTTGKAKASKASARPAPMPAFETGQNWKLGDTTLKIGLVGKTLVHYKHFKTGTPRAPTSLTSKRTLETYLAANRAVLMKS
jgi:hypothetical protein